MNVTEVVLRTLADQFNVDISEVYADSELAGKFDADSLDHLEIAMSLEEELNIDITEEDLVDIKTPADIALICYRKMREKVDSLTLGEQFKLNQQRLSAYLKLGDFRDCFLFNDATDGLLPDKQEELVQAASDNDPTKVGKLMIEAMIDQLPFHESDEVNLGYSVVASNSAADKADDDIKSGKYGEIERKRESDEGS